MLIIKKYFNGIFFGSFKTRKFHKGVYVLVDINEILSVTKLCIVVAQDQKYGSLNENQIYKQRPAMPSSLAITPREKPIRRICCILN